jgi:hypothetical protein
MIKHICLSIAALLLPASAQAALVTINFQTTSNDLGDPVSGTLEFDPAQATLVADGEAYGGLIRNATYASPTFRITYDLFGEKLSGDFLVDVTAYSYGLVENYFYTRVPGTPVNLNFYLAYNSIPVSTALTANGYENAAVSGVLFVAPPNGIIGSATASYTVTYAADAAVPEPAAWMLMIGGFGLVGASLRRRRSYRPAMAV